MRTYQKRRILLDEWIHLSTHHFVPENFILVDQVIPMKLKKDVIKDRINFLEL